MSPCTIGTNILIQGPSDNVTCEALIQLVTHLQHRGLSPHIKFKSQTQLLNFWISIGPLKAGKFSLQGHTHLLLTIQPPTTLWQTQNVPLHFMVATPTTLTILLGRFSQSHTNPHFTGQKLNNKLCSQHKGQFIKPFSWFPLVPFARLRDSPPSTMQPGAYELNMAPSDCLRASGPDSCPPQPLIICPQNVKFWPFVGICQKQRSSRERSLFSCVPTFLVCHG